jgi:type IV pilus assembly protein PilM
MVSWITKPRYGPIGIDLGARSIKLVQLSSDHTRLIDTARWELTSGLGRDVPPETAGEALSAALARALEGRRFRGRQAALCLSDRELFLQNIRVPINAGAGLQRLVQQEAAARLPYPLAEAEIRFLEAADVRHGEHTLREIILFAAHRPRIEAALQVIERAGLRPVAVEVEPHALLRAYALQLRRAEDGQQRLLLVNVGYAKTTVLIAAGESPLFIKYIDVGGRQMDEAVARHLDMALSDAAALRRHNGDRRSDQQDPEIARGVSDAVRPVRERLLNELSLCARYHGVTFRGQPLTRAVLGGGEATAALADAVSGKLELRCQLSDPLRRFLPADQPGRRGQWDVAAGLALREVS